MHSIARQKPTRSKGARITPPPWPLNVTSASWNLDLWPPDPQNWPLDHFCQFVAKSVRSCSQYRVHVKDERSDGPTDEWRGRDHCAFGQCKLAAVERQYCDFRPKLYYPDLYSVLYNMLYSMLYSDLLYSKSGSGKTTSQHLNIVGMLRCGLARACSTANQFLSLPATDLLYSTG